MAQTPDRELTHTPDSVYDLVLVLQQALQDCVRYHRCAEDSRREGDAELADFFDELGRSDDEIAARAKRLLAPRLAATVPDDGRGQSA